MKIFDLLILSSPLAFIVIYLIIGKYKHQDNIRG